MIYKNYEYFCEIFTMTDNEYKYLIDLLEENNPKCICELGSGQSTNIFEQYKKKYNCEFFSIEHNIYFKKDNTILFNLIENTNIQIGNNVYSNVNKYDGLENWLSNQDKFDFVLIDGPFGYGFRENYDYGRVQLLSFVILDKLSDQSTICIHDTERTNMQNMLTEFEKLLNERSFKFNRIIINEQPELTIYKIYKNNMKYIQTSTMPDMQFVYEDQNNHTGWICPKCGRAISPEYKVCPYCSTQATDEGLAPGEQMICDAM